jgi:hypothetical protein
MGTIRPQCAESGLTTGLRGSRLTALAEFERELIRTRTGGRPRRVQRREDEPQAEAHGAPEARGDQPARRGRRNAALDRPQLECVGMMDDFEAFGI